MVHTLGRITLTFALSCQGSTGATRTHGGSRLHDRLAAVGLWSRACTTKLHKPCRDVSRLLPARAPLPPLQTLVSQQAAPVSIVPVPFSYQVVTAEGSSLRVFDLASMHPELSGYISGTRASGTVLTPPTSATSAQIAGVAVYASAPSFATAVAVHSDYTVVVWSLSSFSVSGTFRLTNTVGRVTSVALTGYTLFVGMSCGDSSNTIPGCVNSIDVYNVNAGTLTTRLGAVIPQSQVGGWGCRVRAGGVRACAGLGAG